MIKLAVINSSEKTIIEVRFQKYHVHHGWAEILNCCELTNASNIFDSNLTNYRNSCFKKGKL